ncbi:MAG: hypothetical protein JNM31_09940 [Flavobacteriales bacterium]|nr:hypothetical protein [Flavobacteriales bacterium]
MADKPFTSLDQVRSEKDRLRAQAALHQGRLGEHWANFRQGDFRRALVLRSIKGRLRGMVGGDAASVAVPILVTGLFALLTRTAGRNPWAKAGLGILGAVLPGLIERVMERQQEQAGADDGTQGGGHLFKEFARTWERIKAYIGERRAARAEAAS